MISPEIELAWAAGLFEGEGSIYAALDRGRAKRMMLQMNMTDKDVLMRFWSTVRVGNVSGPRKAKPNHKPMWRWSVGNKRDVSQVLTAFLPMLGERRRTKATEALAVASGLNGRRRP